MVCRVLLSWCCTHVDSTPALSTRGVSGRLGASVASDLEVSEDQIELEISPTPSYHKSTTVTTSVTSVNGAESRHRTVVSTSSCEGGQEESSQQGANSEIVSHLCTPMWKPISCVVCRYPCCISFKFNEFKIHIITGNWCKSSVGIWFYQRALCVLGSVMNYLHSLSD